MKYCPGLYSALIAALLCAIPTTGLHAQIVNHAVGSVDLSLSGYSMIPPYGIASVTDTAPVGLVDAQWQIDLSDFTEEEYGQAMIDYGYTAPNPASARFDIYTNLETADGGNTHASFLIDLTLAAPVRYRVDAEINVGWLGFYDITFNNIHGTASMDELTGADGTFPLIYYGQAAYGWYPYVDEGELPAGQYQLAIETFAHTGRYEDPGRFESTASLTLQLLGDVNLDGFVGLADLGAVLDDWNEYSPAGGSLYGDLDGDGFVGIADLNMVLAAWNADVRTLPASSAVPEPGGVVMLALALASLCGARRI